MCHVDATSWKRHPGWDTAEDEAQYVLEHRFTGFFIETAEKVTSYRAF